MSIEDQILNEQIRIQQERVQAKKELSAGQIVEGVGETAATFATGIVAQPLAGLFGMGDGLVGVLRGDTDVLSGMSDKIEQVSHALTYQPRTEGGKRVLDTVSTPFVWYGEKAREAGMATLEETDSPALATLVQSGIELAPALFGIKKPKVSFKQRSKDVAGVEASAKRVGVGLNDDAPSQIGQVVKSAEVQTGNFTSKAQGIESVVNEIKRLREISKTGVTELYTNARKTKAGIKTGEAQGFLPILEESLKGYDVADMPIVKRRMSELAELNNLPKDSVIRLEKIDNWRKRLNKNRPAATDLSQHRALNVMKGQLDDFLDAQFNSDMISGNPAAIAKWKEARTAHKRYRETYTDNKTIKKLAEQEATPEEIRSWIFGATATGARKEAGSIVGRIKEIVGEDSPQMSSLRQNALLDIMEPLLREEPNFSMFKKNYEKLILNNETLTNQLFPNSKSALKDLYGISKGVDKRPLAKRVIDINRIGATALFGHGIAKAGLKVSMAKKIFNMMGAARGQTAKHLIMSEILGYNPGAALLPKTPLVIGGAIQTGIDQEFVERINKAIAADQNNPSNNPQTQ